MSDPPTHSDDPRSGATAPKPYPRTALGWVVWVGLAVLLLSLVNLDVYRKGKRFKIKSRQWAQQEARTTIAKLRVQQEAYRAEHGVYLGTTTEGEDDLYPAPGSEPQRRRFQPRIDHRAAWAILAPAMPKTQMWCGYVIVAGPAGSLAPAGPRGKSLFANRAPSVPWYYIRAQCIQGEGKVLVYETTSASDQLISRE